MLRSWLADGALLIQSAATASAASASGAIDALRSLPATAAVCPRGVLPPNDTSGETAPAPAQSGRRWLSSRLWTIRQDVGELSIGLRVGHRLGSRPLVRWTNAGR